MCLLSAAAGTMLPRNIRTGGYNLPGVESDNVPLIGFRPLSPDRGTISGHSGRRAADAEVQSSQVNGFYFASKWMDGWMFYICILVFPTITEKYVSLFSVMLPLPPTTSYCYYGLFVL